MASDMEIKTALERATKALQLRPGLAQSTMKNVARLGDGMKCISKEGDWSLAMDVPQGYGGDHSGPSPGVYGRSALTGCLAIGLKMNAVQMDVPLDSVEVILEVDGDDRADFGLDDVPPGYQAFRLLIQVRSRAPRKDIERVIEQTQKVSPLLDLFVRAQKIETQIAIESRSAAAE